MPGRRIKDKQVKIYMSSRLKGATQEVSAAKAGISIRSGRNLEGGKRRVAIHCWRTRSDPFIEVWESELIPMLECSPGLSPITLLEYLQDRYSQKYPDSVLRTLERRVKEWRALQGPEKEVMFRQRQEPGRQGLSDFTQLKGIIITIRGKPLHHLLYHFRLAYSHWSYMKVILGGESYTALAEGLQEALWRLGGCPLDHRTDSLSAAFKNLSRDEQEDRTKKYDELCRHYNMRASRNNPGAKHENGAVESPHGHLKRRIKQALLLRGSNDFQTIIDYQIWLDQVVQSHNRRNAKQIDSEKKALQLLPTYRAVDFIEVVVKVTSSSTIDVRRVTYTVPSRLCGETLRIHLYHDRLCCFLGSAQIITLDRVYPTGTHNRARNINYRHVIKALVRKPQAFRYSQIREDLLPGNDYKKIWVHIDNSLPGKAACKLMVGILSLAAKADCEEKLAYDVLDLITTSKPISLTDLQKRYLPTTATHPTVNVSQHPLNNYDSLIIGVSYA
ncbi:MAG: IS21 family transposase [Candidatus Cloacimonadota bacterium]|nr:IS21 family transposase [Candidatus Cloacimonadota bacterium]